MSRLALVKVHQAGNCRGSVRPKCQLPPRIVGDPLPPQQTRNPLVRHVKCTVDCALQAREPVGVDGSVFRSEEGVALPEQLAVSGAKHGPWGEDLLLEDPSAVQEGVLRRHGAPGEAEHGYSLLSQQDGAARVSACRPRRVVGRVQVSDEASVAVGGSGSTDGQIASTVVGGHSRRLDFPVLGVTLDDAEGVDPDVVDAELPGHGNGMPVVPRQG